jgi:hypothetical protein
VTVGGVSVPAGDYSVSPARDSHNNWTLTMKKPVRIGRSGAYWVLSPFMSATTSALPIEGFPVSFDQTGGSCKLYWSQKSDTLLSLEFTEKNADLPLLR